MATVTQSADIESCSSGNVDKVVQSVTNATKRLSQISTNTNNSSMNRKTQNRIGPWKLGRTLGRGSTGRVRLAKNIHTGKLAAVKIVPKSNFKKLENPKYKRPAKDNDRLPYGIEREIVIMKLIAHPNIMGLYDVWENKSDLYLILEYIEGGELFDYLIKRGKLQEFEAINYFKQIIHGINYLHQFNICHRDLKPENLLLDFNKKIKIADFGMAALETKEKLLETSCGSPHYASPEIVAGKNYHGAPSDIWSCGIILFALLTGHLPFDDENIRKLLLKVQNGKFIMPTDLSWEAKDLISNMLKVNPNDRITIDAILTHPLLTKYPDPASKSSSSVLDLKNSCIQPITSVEKIDKDILKSLSVLFHNCNDSTLISKLLSPSNNSEKMFYYLLMKYRNEHTSAKNFADDEDSDTAKAIPRSTSIVKMTITDETTGESTTVVKKEKIAKTKRNDVLSNITNISRANNSPPQSRVFKASTSFNKKKAHKTNMSRSSSSKSIRGNKPPQLQPPKLSKSDFDQENAPVYRISPKRSPKRLVSEKSVSLPRKNQYQSNKSLLNFEKICEDVFGDENTSYQPEVTITQESTIAKLKANERMMLSIREREREFKLQAIAKRQEDAKILAREKEIRRAKEEAKARKLEQLEFLKKEQAKREQEAKEAAEKKDQLAQEMKRQSFLLQKKQREALSKLNDNKPRLSSSPVFSSKGSLDPRSAGVDSLLRAKSLGNPSFSTRGKCLNEKNAKVLQLLGIELQSPKLDFSSKTSSSRNLNDYLSNTQVAEDDDRLSLTQFNKLERTGSQLKPTLSGKAPTNSMGYKSLLSNDAVEKNPVVDEDEEKEDHVGDLTNMTVNNPSLIPNPRFSRFSFNGLLNKFDAADTTILNNTLTTGGTVIKRPKKNVDGTTPKLGSTAQLKTEPGNGLIRKSSTTNLLGLGINVKGKSSQQRNVSSKSHDNTGFLSVNISDTHEEMDSYGDSSLAQNAISMAQHDNSSDETIMDEEYNLSDNLVNMDQTSPEFDYSNYDIISSRTAEVGTLNKMRPSIVEHLDASKETLIEEKPYEATDEYDASNVHILDTSSVADVRDHELEEEARNHVDLSDQLQRNNTTVKKPKRVSINSKPDVRISTTMEDTPASKQESIFRRLSLKPKREAPRAPETTSSPVSPMSQSSGYGSTPKMGWFKKFFSSIASKTATATSPGEKRKSFLKFLEEKPSEEAVEVIDSVLMSLELIRVIKNQLELKKIEGSVSSVDIDEEFGLINGLIPAKYANGRKLKFKIEIIDLISTSSLHLHKIKGSDKGFKNLANVVQFIIKQEEEDRSSRASNAYKFSGYATR